MAELMSYDPTAMRTAAKQIQDHVHQAQLSYEKTWRTTETFINSFPGFMQPFVRNIFNPHDTHYRNSHQWQLDFADRLIRAASAIEAADTQAANTLNNQH
ncbi:hypothetical protein [Tengunoibacter tsumagoiensis]|uniref:Uncharacterized protein n=1 Tax=Tengunoibacter tsumagoiensis TaxID=2014871 RepID=A0A401ZUQ1_9CHLR|nr:hypothetical protein [Tengunoibacter tsumagoiensis]GCE10678.1 hypothetical protein KTT_05370 [Tengunoibacter tsumagoiensis]